jgi:hypothetical protein
LEFDLVIPKGIDLSLLARRRSLNNGDGRSISISESAREEHVRGEVRLLVERKESIEVRAFFTFLLILAAQRKLQTKTKLVEQNEG